MQLIEQGIDRQGAEGAQASHIVTADEKKLRVQHNTLLAKYFNGKAKEPFELLEKLIE